MIPFVNNNGNVEKLSNISSKEFAGVEVIQELIYQSEVLWSEEKQSRHWGAHEGLMGQLCGYDSLDLCGMRLKKYKG